MAKSPLHFKKKAPQGALVILSGTNELLVVFC